MAARADARRRCRRPNHKIYSRQNDTAVYDRLVLFRGHTAHRTRIEYGRRVQRR